jgi:glycosyltransferase involved in cell wall biosynthesis
MARLKVDLFHGVDFSVPYLPLRPSVMTVHDLSPWMDSEWQPAAHRIRARTPKLLKLGAATMVVTPSQAIRSAMIEKFGLAPSRVVAIPLAASEHFRPVETPPPARPYLLFVGTLEPRKNIGRIIEAWREVARTHNVDLVLAGRIREDFQEPQAEPGLLLKGPVPEEDLPALYAGAAAVVYVSLYEGFGLPVLEAMQCGALVITSNDPAIQEIAHGAAISIDAPDTRSLARAMRLALDSTSEVRDLRKRALERAGQYSWKRTAELTRDTYDAAVRAFAA